MHAEMFERSETSQAVTRSAQPRPTTRCGVCGFAEVRTDVAVDRERLVLAECPRCEYRWTARAPEAQLRPTSRRLHKAPARVFAEAAPAA
jgi:hypothetical protein